MAKENVPMERNHQIVEFIRKIDNYYGCSVGRKDWKELILKTPEIISADFFEMVNPLSGEQIAIVRKGVEAGLDIEAIQIYAKPEFSTSIMENILAGILAGIELDKIRLYAKKCFWNKIVEFNNYAMKLDTETLKKYFNLNLSGHYTAGILNALAEGCLEERVKILYDKWWKNEDQFDKVLNYVKNAKITLEQLEVIANPEFNVEQMEEVGCGYLEYLRNAQVALYADPEKEAILMKYIRIGLKKCLTYDAIVYYEHIYKKFGEYAMDQVYSCFEDGWPMEVVKVLVNLSSADNKVGTNITIVRNQISAKRCSLQELQEIVNTTTIPTFDSFKAIFIGKHHKLSIDNIKYCAQIRYGISESILGFAHGLTQEQVKLLTTESLEFMDTARRNVRLCLEYGMNTEYIQALIEKKQWEALEVLMETVREKDIEESELYSLISENLN